MSTPNQPGQQELVELAWHLVRLAERAGFVVTIERTSIQPLAMGNHEPVVCVRPARKREMSQQVQA